MDTTILTNVSTSPSRFDAGLAAKERMKKIGLNKIFIAPVAPLGLRSPSKPPVGAVNDPIPPRIGQRAASEIGAWPDSGAAKTLHRAAQVLETAAANGWTFPYLFDADQSVARAYTAACTPDFFLFDANKALVYRGQLDDSRPKSDIPVDGKDLRQALNALATGEAIASDQKPALGCGIKWAPGQAPAYMGGDG